MAVYKDPHPTKDGRCWYFKIEYKDVFENNKQFRSKRFMTKKEAQDAERTFLITSTNKVEDNNMTFLDLYKDFSAHNDEIMKDTAIYGYENKEKFIECFYNIKVKDFNIMHYEQWKKYANSLNISTRYKNDILKFLKSVMNYATVWHEFNFVKVYPKMTNFNNSSEVQKEMMYFTYDEWKQFISVENDLQFKVMFEILYYCGLRKGELRGLTWSNIDLDNKTLSVRKQITDRGGKVKSFEFSTPKTKR